MRVARDCFLLELQPQGELDLPGTAVRTGSGSHRCRCRAAHGLRDFAKCRRARLVVARIREIGVIEKIEEVRTERQTASIAPYCKTLQRCEIVVHQAWAVVLISSGGADPSGGRDRRKVAGAERGVRIGIVLG